MRQAHGVIAFKGHIQGVAFLVGVFDFKFGQRRGAIKTPVHGFETTVNKTALHHALEDAQLPRFIGGVHGAVRVVPFAQHAQAFEIFALAVDLLGGKGAAFGLHIVAAEFAAVDFFNRVFNRQAVAVPTRNVGRVITHELARLDDDVFQNLVDGVANVDVAIGIGRAVVQHKFGRTRTGSTQLLVNAFFFPFCDPFGFALGQVAAHGEGGVGQVQGFGKIDAHGAGGKRGGYLKKGVGRAGDGGFLAGEKSAGTLAVGLYACGQSL